MEGSNEGAKTGMKDEMKNVRKRRKLMEKRHKLCKEKGANTVGIEGRKKNTSREMTKERNGREV